MFKSTDGGAGWEEIWKSFNSHDMWIKSPLVVDPLDPNILYAETSEGTRRSLDAGVTWSPAGDPVIHRLVSDPINPGTLYSIGPGGVYRSVGGGEDWSSFNDSLANLHVETLVISPSNPETLYAGIHGGGVFKHASMLTLDYSQYCTGESWKLTVTGAKLDSFVRLIGVSNGASWDIPEWGRTDRAGDFAASGIFPDGSDGDHTLRVEIDGVISNAVSVLIHDCGH